MNKSAEFDAWSAGRSYDLYMGRWSRQLAGKFIDWLAPPRDAVWLDAGCGTGALTAAILANRALRSILSVDPSEGFLAHAMVHTPGCPGLRRQGALARARGKCADQPPTITSRRNRTRRSSALDAA